MPPSLRRIAGSLWRHPRRVLALLVLVAVVVPVALALARARLDAPPPTLVLRDQDGRFLAELGTGAADEEFGYWPLEALPHRVVVATLALEDRRFWDHPGVDVRAMGRAVLQAVRHRRVVSGASTIAMQVARMQDPGPRTVPRKGVEALTALALTARYDRQAVLAHYLRIAPYGNRIRGIRFAAHRYLGKPVEDLSWAEVAFLCALPQSPARTDPHDVEGRRRARQRATRILDTLLADGDIDPAEHAQARRDLEHLVPPPRETRPLSAMHAVLLLEERLRSDPGLREALAADPVVTTSLDLDLQETVQAFLAADLARWADLGAVNGAVVVMEARTREVEAWVGSAGWDEAARAGSLDYARVPRSAGSTLKPFLYGLAYERGLLEPGSVLDDTGRATGGVANADRRFLGPLLPRQALACSRNVPAVHVLERVGLEPAHAFLQELGLHDGDRPATWYGVGMAIGGIPVRLGDLVRAYGVLAGDGTLHDLRWFPDLPQARGRRLLSEDTTRLLALHLSDPLARLPVFPRMGFSEYPFPVAVKTGTSEDFRDAWAVAWSRDHVVGVWVGHPDWRPMKGLSGYRAGARLAQQVLTRLHAGETDGLADLAFPPPEGWSPVRICPRSGQPAGAACEVTVTEWFPPGKAPSAACALHGAPAPGGAPGDDAPVRVTVLAPEDGLRLLPDPDVAADRATLALRVKVEPPVPQVLWLVDGAPLALVPPPYTARWVPEPGRHRFQAVVPYQPFASPVVDVEVR